MRTPFGDIFVATILTLCFGIPVILLGVWIGSLL